MHEPESKTEQQPNTSRWLNIGWITVLLMALSAAVAQVFGRFSYGVLFPAIRDELGISNSLAGLIGAANVGAYLLGTLVVAWATSRYRLLNMLRLGIVLSTFGLCMTAFASGPWMLAGALFVAGIGGAFVWIPGPVIAADALPDHQRPIAVGLMGSGIGLGVMFVSVLSGTLRSSQGDAAWSSVYQVQVAIGIVATVLILLIVRHQQASPSSGPGNGGFSALQRMPGWLPLIVAYFAFGFMYLLILGFLTTRLEDDSGWTSTDASFAFTLLGFSMIFGGPLFAAIAQRSSVRMAAASAFGIWPILVLIVLTGYPLPTMLACLGLGLAFGALPTLITLYVVQNTSASDYGPSFAAVTLAFGIAQTISPPLGGLIADQTNSFTLVFILAAIVGVVGLLASLRLPAKNLRP